MPTLLPRFWQLYVAQTSTHAQPSAHSRAPLEASCALLAFIRQAYAATCHWHLFSTASGPQGMLSKELQLPNHLTSSSLTGEAPVEG